MQGELEVQSSPILEAHFFDAGYIALLLDRPLQIPSRALW